MFEMVPKGEGLITNEAQPFRFLLFYFCRCESPGKFGEKGFLGTSGVCGRVFLWRIGGVK